MQQFHEYISQHEPSVVCRTPLVHILGPEWVWLDGDMLQVQRQLGLLLLNFNGNSRAELPARQVKLRRRVGGWRNLGKHGERVADQNTPNYIKIPAHIRKYTGTTETGAAKIGTAKTVKLLYLLSED